MIWWWAALLTLGLLLLTYTTVRVLAGGLSDGPRAAATVRPGRHEPAEVLAGPSRARQILDERYASGELSTQEYQHRRAVLAGREESA